MHGARTLLGATLAVAALFVPSEASAGVTAPLSSIALLPAPVAMRAPAAGAPAGVAGVVGVSLKARENGAHRWLDLVTAASRGYCLSTGDETNGHRWTSNYGASSGAPSEDFDLDRFVQKEDKVTLERTRVHFDPPSETLTATGRSQVDLVEISRNSGVVVWAYREGSDVVVLARDVERGVESRRESKPEDGVVVPFISADGCPFAGARLDGRRPQAGTVAQLAGNLPARGTGKEKVVPRFLVDVSLSRVSRDPEPVLAVRIRIHD